MDGKRAFKLLKKIGFERVSGSKEELKAANILLDETKDGHLEEFEVDGHTINVAKLEVLEPFYKEYYVTGYGQAGNTPDNGLEGEFYYFENDSKVCLENAKGKIVLVNGYVNYRLYKKFFEAGAIGFISYNGELRDNFIDYAYPELREPLRKLGVIPGVNLSVKDAFDLVKSNPKKVRITLKQETYKKLSHNVVAEIKGSSKPEEIIVLTAHFDSVKYSTGVYDNGAGSVIQMEAYKYFLKHQPKRTIKFIWCGSEERGLLGSKNYVATHEEELKNIKLCVNCDVAAPVLGSDAIIVTGNEEIANYCKFVSTELGIPAVVREDTYSSDEIPFADKGIPGISVMRFGSGGTAYIHNRHDIIKYLDYQNLERTGKLEIGIIERIANSDIIPFNCTVSNEMKDKVDIYLFKKEPKN